MWQMTVSFLPTCTVLPDQIILRLVQLKAGPSVRLCLLNFTVLSLDATQCFYFMFASLAEPATNERSWLSVICCIKGILFCPKLHIQKILYLNTSAMFEFLQSMHCICEVTCSSPTSPAHLLLVSVCLVLSDRNKSMWCIVFITLLCRFARNCITDLILRDLKCHMIHSAVT